MNAAWRESRIAHWLFADRGPETKFELHHRRIFTLPTRTGMVFLAMLALLLIASINYQLSLGYVLTFMVGAASWIGLHHTFANLAGLRLAASTVAPVFAGEVASFEFEASDERKRARYAIAVHGPHGRLQFNLAAGNHRRANIECLAPARGWLAAPRATIETVFPLGLWRAWSYWQPAQRCLVYPAPETPAPPLPALSIATGDAAGAGAGSESFAALRAYQPGDSPRIVAWKAVARSADDVLSSKQFEGSSQGELWLDIALAPPALGLEARLSRLAAWVLAADAEGIDYGLRVFAQERAPAHGPAHRDACLKLLALTGIAESLA